MFCLGIPFYSARFTGPLWFPQKPPPQSIVCELFYSEIPWSPLYSWLWIRTFIVSGRRGPAMCQALGKGLALAQ